MQGRGKAVTFAVSQARERTHPLSSQLLCELSLSEPSPPSPHFLLALPSYR